MKKIKAVFFDIDGTLVSFKTHSVPQSTIEAISILQNKGIKTFIASGRQYALINNLGNLHFDGYVTINGALTLIDGQMVDSHPIPPSDIKTITAYLESQQKFPCFIVTQNNILLNYSNADVEEIKQLINFPDIPIANINTIANEPIYQLIAFFGEDKENSVMQCLPHCTTARWHPLFTDIIASGVSKVVGMECICKHFGISPEETMAFGDGGNDIEMLQWAGIGVAMDNANDEVKRHANHITQSVDNNGILNAVKLFL